MTNNVAPPNWTGPKGRFIWRQLSRLNRTKFGRLFLYLVTRFTIERVSVVKVLQTEFKLAAVNPRLDMRNQTYAKKEPETLSWIESFDKGSVLWDIGANIGLYSLYAAKVRNCNVVAFEPSVFCLEFLARNIWLNDLHEQITIVPNALSDTTQTNLLTLYSREWGNHQILLGQHSTKMATKLMPVLITGFWVSLWMKHSPNLIFQNLNI